MRASRRREELWPVIAVSVARLADSLGIEESKIRAAIKDDLLPYYQHGVKRRVLIVDAIEWVRKTWPKVK